MSVSNHGLILIYSKYINIWALASIINKLVPLICKCHCIKILSKVQDAQTTAARLWSYIPGHGAFPTASSRLGYLWLHRQMITFESHVDSSSELRVLIRSSDKTYLVFCSSTFLLSLIKAH